MKLLKYFLFIAILIASALFITKLDDSNKMSDVLGDNIDKVDPNAPIVVQIPYIVGKDSQSIFGLEENIEIKYVIIGSLSLGVAIGFLMALFQIISQKSQMIKQRSKLKKLQIELDTLRNQAIDDDIEIIDKIDDLDSINDDPSELDEFIK